jgi:hypothetical protein
MNESLFELYCRTKKLIERTEDCKTPHNHTEEMLAMLQGWRESNEVIEETYPQIKDMWRQRQDMINSFSREQIDFICYQIGDWYCQWHDKMWVDGKPNQHWLGMAKEQLKIMICGN